MIPKTITITHLDAETCVTGSCHLVQFQPDPRPKPTLNHVFQIIKYGFVGVFYP